MEFNDLNINREKTDFQYIPSDDDLDKLIAQKSFSSLNLLKAEYKRQLIILPSIAALFFLTTLISTTAEHTILVWISIFMLLLLALIYYRNYILVLSIMKPHNSGLKNRLEEKIGLFDQYRNQQLFVLKVLFLIFILGLESTLYFKQHSAFQFLQVIILPVRMIFYLMLLIIQPYMSKYFYNINFGHHISRLYDIVNQED